MSKKKNRLRALSKDAPTPPEIEKLMEALSGEADFAVVITAGALLETALERLIVSKLKRHSKQSLEDLFSFNGPMGTFSSKIQIADAFGLITSPMTSELHVVRNLRNAFAHSRTPLTFENPLVEREVTEMIISSAVQQHIEVENVSKFKGRHSFLLTTRLLLIFLDSLANSELPPDQLFRLETRSKRSENAVANGDGIVTEEPT